MDVAVAPDGAVYIRGREPYVGDRLYKVSVDGIVSAFTGGRREQYREPCARWYEEDAPALRLCRIATHSHSIEISGDGTVYFTEGRTSVRKISPALPNFSPDSIFVASQDGSQLYEFDGDGRHLKTLDALTGSVIYRFGYDANRRLVRVTDADGNVTTIERDGAGLPSAIVAPGGQRTLLLTNSRGYLGTVTNPAGETTSFTYTPEGLMTREVEPNGGIHKFQYDAVGRLVRDENPDGQAKTITRTETGTDLTVKVTTGLGRTTTYKTEALPSGEHRRSVTKPSGETTTLIVNTDGTQTVVAPDGTRTTTETGPDPRWGMRAPLIVSRKVITPGGRRLETSFNRDVRLKDPKNPLSVQSITDTMTLDPDTANAKSFRTETLAPDPDSGQPDWRIDSESAESRQRQVNLDTRGRVKSIVLDPQAGGYDGTTPVTFQYTPKGRLAKMQQGALSLTYSYDELNRLVAIDNAEGGETTFTYDAADRLVSKRLPGGQLYRFVYARGGDLTAVVSPKGQVNAFTWTKAHDPDTYRPPGAAGLYDKAYDADGTMVTSASPGGGAEKLAYRADGRQTKSTWIPAGSSTPELTDSYEYPSSGALERPTKMTRVGTANPNEAIAFSYDGFLPTGLTYTGIATGTSTVTYGADLLPIREKLTIGTRSVLDRALAYDKDGRVTRYGSFSFVREGPNGALSRIANGSVQAESYTYDGLGRVKSKTLKAGTADRYKLDLTYDSVGRVVKKDETIGGAIETTNYSYDVNGQLIRASGAANETFAYDPNGNRTSPTAAYDSQDRLTKLGGVTYTYSDDGYLAKRSADTFKYTVSGTLAKAIVGGRQVTYAYDMLGRRVSRTVGTNTWRYLYSDAGNPFKITAVLEPNGTATTLYYDEDDLLFAMDRGTKRYYVATDQVGSPRLVVDSSGNVVKRVSYSSFGTVKSDSAPTFYLPFGFAGGLDDPMTHLVRFGFRDYDPASGHWMGRDPIFFRGSPTNLYAYVGNDPQSNRDPTGLACFGISAFGGPGGGIQYCRKDGKNSICGEIGVGVGGGVEVDPFGDVAKDGGTITGEVTGKWGPLSGTVGFETDLDCFNSKGYAKAGAGPFTLIGIDTNGTVITPTGSFGGPHAKDFSKQSLKDSFKGERTESGSWGTKAEGKLSWKQCGSW